YSRYDIFALAERLSLSDEFIIIIDDYNRPGEIDTAKDLVNLFNKKSFKIHTGIFSGIKSQYIIASEKYKYIISV
ncbi:MAG: hypothetical protein ABIP69_00275, partial [Ferruginibacter sp.]